MLKYSRYQKQLDCSISLTAIDNFHWHSEYYLSYCHVNELWRTDRQNAGLTLWDAGNLQLWSSELVSLALNCKNLGSKSSWRSLLEKKKVLKNDKMTEIQQREMPGWKHLVSNNSMYSYGLESSSAGKDMGVLVDTKLSKGQQSDLATKKVNVILGWISRIVVSRSREVILHLCTAPVRLIWGAGSRTELSSTREIWTYWRKSSKGLQRRLTDWSVSHKSKGWESWDCWA